MTLTKAKEYAAWNLTRHPQADPTLLFYKARNGQWLYASAKFAKNTGEKTYTCQEMEKL